MHKAYFAALGNSIGLLVFVGAHAKVLNGLTGVPLPSEKNSIGADLPARIQNALLGRVSETKSRNGQFGDLEKTDVIGDSSDLNDDFGREVGGAGGFLYDAGEGNGRTVDLGEEQTVEDDLVEVRIRPAGQETVELKASSDPKYTIPILNISHLHKEKQVRILTGRCSTVSLLAVMLCQVDPLREIIVSIEQNGDDSGELTMSVNFLLDLVLAGLRKLDCREYNKSKHKPCKNCTVARNKVSVVAEFFQAPLNYLHSVLQLLPAWLLPAALQKDSSKFAFYFVEEGLLFSEMYAEGAPPPPMPQDPYSQEYNDAPPPPDRDREALPPPPRGRSRSRSAPRENGYRSPYRRRSPPPAATPRRPPHAPIAPNPSNVLGVFGLSIRTQERDLDEEFSRFGRVEKVTIVYDQRSDRSRGFGFIRMATVEEATRCIQELNGIDLNGRRIRVDYSVTDRPHAPTPGEYMGHRRQRDTYTRDRDRDRDYHRDRDRDHYRRDRDRDRDPYGRDSRDWRERRSPAPRRGHSPEYRRRRSYSRSPPRGSSPSRRDYDAPPPESRW
ncbi:transformer-2-beta isoform 3 [Moniliophthora roreri]|nr:transformer-2-beta isoform 3 [Moniliophthora roreri]